MTKQLRIFLEHVATPNHPRLPEGSGPLRSIVIPPDTVPCLLFVPRCAHLDIDEEWGREVTVDEATADYVVKTPRGWHLYYMSITPGSKEHEDLIMMWGADKRSSSPGHEMRTPGSVKNGFTLEIIKQPSGMQ